MTHYGNSFSSPVPLHSSFCVSQSLLILIFSLSNYSFLSFYFIFVASFSTCFFFSSTYQSCSLYLLLSLSLSLSIYLSIFLSIYQSFFITLNFSLSLSLSLSISLSFSISHSLSLTLSLSLLPYLPLLCLPIYLSYQSIFQAAIFLPRNHVPIKFFGQ